MVGEVWDFQIVPNCTNVQGCIGSNAKTLGLQYLQFRDMGASGGPPNGTRKVHLGTVELIIQQNTISDEETASTVQERSQRSKTLCRFLSHLIYTFQQGEVLIKGQPKITGVVEPLDWLPEEM
jgi:hypothetical protein